MTEQEYLDAGDLVRVRTAINILKDILPSCSDIDSADYYDVVQILSKLEKTLYNNIKIDE